MSVQSLAAAEILLEFTAEGVVLAALGSWSMWLLRNASAALRHRVLTLLFAALTVLPVTTAFLPARQLSLLPAVALSEPAAMHRQGEEPPRREREPQSVIAEGRPAPAPWPFYLVLAWAGIAAAIFARQAFIHLGVRRDIRKSTAPLKGAAWRTSLDDILHESLAGKPPALLECTDIVSPVLVGLFRPRILIPSRAVDWPGERLRVVLLHELAHLKRRDLAAQLLSHVVCTLHWVNPLVWWARHRLIIEQERAADDSVLGSGVRASRYAQQLLELSNMLKDPRTQASSHVAAMARGTDFRDRIVQLLDPVAKRDPIRMRSTLLTTLIALVILAPFVVFTPWAHGASRSPISRTADAQRSDGAAHGSGSDIRALVAALESGHRETRINAVWALSALGEEEAKSAVILALNHEDPGVGNAAVNAIAQWPAEESIPILIKAIDAKHPAVRVSAVWALSRMDDERALAAVRSAVDHEDGHVRNAALSALRARAAEGIERPPEHP